RLSNLTVAARLWLALGFSMLAVIAATAIVGWRLEAVISHAEALDNEHANRRISAMQWVSLVRSNIVLVQATAIMPEAASRELLMPLIAEGTRRISNVQSEIEGNSSGSADRQILNQIRALRTEVLAALSSIRTAKAGASSSQIASALQEFDVTSKRYLAALDDYAAFQAQLANAVHVDAATKRHDLLLKALGGMALLFVLMICGAGALVRSIRLPLSAAVAATKEVSEGNLSHQFNSSRGDEFGELHLALDQMCRRLRGLISVVRDGVGSVDTAVNEIAVGNQDLSWRTEQAAASLQRTANAVMEITASVKQSADGAARAAQLAHEADRIARDSGSAVVGACESMARISSSAKQIAEITSVIDAMAFQTNILALNAAVEASRAGELGRGFAVVASEVRTLSHKSASAAKQIKVLIQSSVEQISDGERRVKDAAASMSLIVAHVGTLSVLIAELAKACKTQSFGIQDVNAAIVDLDRATQQNAALVEQSAAAAASLRDNAGRLSVATSVFVFDQ
ncbi:methyl-accepting chemotaxis protein, partial [Nostoc sp. CHAB 5836]|uniref:methyl-accepting chemotaxis protein n=1 Tax=Nostoc sp. CHAB 5836 TaxID=2780404 RepID=UPI001E34A551